MFVTVGERMACDFTQKKNLTNALKNCIIGKNKNGISSGELLTPSKIHEHSRKRFINLHSIYERSSSNKEELSCFTLKYASASCLMPR